MKDLHLPPELDAELFFLASALFPFLPSAVPFFCRNVPFTFFLGFVFFVLLLPFVPLPSCFPFSLLLLVANSLFFPLTPGFVVRNVVYIVATYIDCRT